MSDYVAECFILLNKAAKFLKPIVYHSKYIHLHSWKYCQTLVKKKMIIETDIFGHYSVIPKYTVIHASVQIHIRVPYSVGTFVHGKILSV